MAGDLASVEIDSAVAEKSREPDSPSKPILTHGSLTSDQIDVLKSTADFQQQAEINIQASSPTDYYMSPILTPKLGEDEQYI